jgi:transposase
MLPKKGWVLMTKKYIVDLTQQEKADLQALIRKGKRAARTIMRSHILLLASDGKPDALIAETLHIGVRTVERTRQKFVEGGLEWALSDRPSSAASKRKLNGKQEAFLIASACSEPPQGRAKWTMQLLANQLVTLGLVDSISDETVRRTLKKTKSSRG